MELAERKVPLYICSMKVLQRHIPLLLWAVRLALGGVLLFSGVGKLLDPSTAQNFVETVAREVEVLSVFTALPLLRVVQGFAVLELVIAALLVVGIQARQAFLALLSIVVLFTIALGALYLRGEQVPTCGCFGAFGGEMTLEVALLRNLVLMALILAGLVLTTHTKKTKNGSLPISIFARQRTAPSGEV